MEEHAHIRHLFQQYLENQHSPAELQELLQHFGMTSDNPLLKTLIQESLEKDPDLTTHIEERVVIAQHLDENVLEATRPVRKFRLRRWHYAAAAIIVALATALYLYRSDLIVHQEILPGYNQATLTLANGKTIRLDSAQSGIIINNEDIKYNDGKNVLAEKRAGQSGSGNLIVNRNSSIVNNVLTTPKGGQYQIILSDGTKVWLNAASTLKYPSRFSGNSREVEISGEGYFEVNNKMAETRSTALRSAQGDAKNVKPFVVKSKSQEVLVLGTSFNISSYEDESSVKTTLVTGAIQVASYTEAYSLQPKAYSLLVPGEQSTVQSNGKLTKAKVALDGELAWHNNEFNFTHKNLSQVMKELERWYDLTVVYEGDIPTMEFEGNMPRNLPLSKVLDVLQSVKVNFRVEPGRKLIISQKAGGKP